MKTTSLMLILAFTCTALLTIGGVGATDTTATDADVVVSPGDSIQDAINSSSAGDTVEVEGGTYEESLYIDKNIELVAAGDVTLDGNSLDDTSAVVVETANFSIEGFEIARFSDNGITVRGGLLASRTIEIVDVRFRLNDGHNIQVSDNPDPDTVTLQDVVAEQNGAAANVFIRAESVTITNTEIDGSEDNGVDIAAGSEGSIDIQNSTILNAGEDNPYPDDGPEKGVYLRSAQSITIEDTEVSNSVNDGIFISQSDAIAGGRTINLTNLTVENNGGNNLVVQGTNDPDTVALHNSSSVNNNGGASISISGIETVAVDTIEIDGSEDSGVDIAAGSEGSIDIQNSTILNAGEDNPYPDDGPEKGMYLRSAQSITIEDTEVSNSVNDGIFISSSDVTAGGRTINLTNLTVEDNGVNNFELRGTNDPDTVTLHNISSANNNEAANIFISGIETVTVNNTEIDGSEDSGLDIAAGSEGSIDIQNSTISNAGEDNPFPDDGPEKGMYLRSAQSVTIENIEVSDSESDGITIQKQEIAQSRTIAIRNASSHSNGGDGGQVAGTDSNTTITINSSDFTQNEGDGLDLRTDNTVISGSRVEANSGDGLRFASGIANATVGNSVIVDNGGAEVRNEDTEAVVDARNNWWGDSAGPAAEDIVGNVNVSDPLGSSPGISIGLEPSTLTTEPQTQETLNVTLSDVGNGVDLYEFNLSVANASVTEISSVTPTTSGLSENITITGDGSAATVSVVLSENAYQKPTVTVATVTIQSGAEGSTNISLTDPVVAQLDNEYTIGTVTGTNITVMEDTGPSIGDYTTDNNLIDISGLRNAIGDWRNSQIGVSLLRDVISQWRSGTPVN